ncbi:MAG: hypothetical protein D3917_16190 [Candidatus Electrothrix sp. AX5]|nr:hypothetical protein [Candidatus Electrothrix sp. AX5]
MPKRKRTPSNIETEVLTQSARRCCICYGLHNDFEIKKGQIAHLDRNPANSNFDNLAWLCFEHHDEYDSITRQSKGLTISEVKGYRNQLYNTIFEIRNPPTNETSFTVTYDSSPSSATIRTEDQFVLLSTRVGGIDNYMIELTKDVLADLEKHNDKISPGLYFFETLDYQKLMLRGVFFDNKHGAATIYIDLLHDWDTVPDMTITDIERLSDRCYGDQSIFVSAAIIRVNAGSDSFRPISDEFYKNIFYR